MHNTSENLIVFQQDYELTKEAGAVREGGSLMSVNVQVINIHGGTYSASTI